MKKNIKLVFFFILFSHSFISISQQDTLFWFAAPDISSVEGESPIQLNLASYSNATVITIDQPANGAFAPIIVNLGANASTVVDLTPFITSIESSGADVVGNTGLRIVSTEMISASYEILHPTNRELFTLKGNKGLGLNFYTPFQNFLNTTAVTPVTYSSFEIIATEDNTTIAITPKTNIVGHIQGTTFTVNLNQGETYSARDMDNLATSSLAGSIVASNKPVSVTVFQGAIASSNCTSTLGEQITAVEYLGTNFIVNKGQSQNERFYLLATENGTTISVDNSTTTNSLISWSETFEYVLNDNINYIKTNKPSYLIQVSGNGCNMGMTQVPQVSCAGKYDQAFARESVDSFGIMIHIRAGFESMFTLNGNTSLISASDFTIVPGTSGEYMSALVYFNTTDLPVNAYNLLTNSGDIFGLATISGSSTTGTAFSYVSEFESYSFINAGADATVCANSSINISGLIGGGDVTGTWATTGFGSFDQATSNLTNLYIPSDLDTIISPIELVLTSNGACPILKDTILLTVTASPIVSASADQSVCSNNALISLNGEVGGATTTGVWTTLGNGTFSPNNTDLNAVYTPSTTDLLAGSVKLVLSSSLQGTCQIERDTMEVVFTNAPIVNVIPDTLWVCENNISVNLTGTVVGSTTTGKWITGGNGIFTPDNLSLTCAYQPTPQDILAGNVTIFLESTSNANCFSEKDSVVVMFTAQPMVNAGVDIISCSNDVAITLSGLVSGVTTTGVWSGGGGVFNDGATDLNTTYTPSLAEVTNGSTIITLTSTNNLTCLSTSDVVEINFVAEPFANFSFTEVCENDTTFFNDFSLNGYGNIITWNWNFGTNGTSNLTNTYSIFNDAGSVPVQLIVISDAGCSDTITKNVNTYAKPNANFSYDASCVGDNVIINFTDESTIVNSLITNWNYDFGGQGNQSVQNPVSVFLAEGNFTVTQIVTSITGCKDTVSQIINIPPKPIAGFFFDTDNGLNIGAEFNYIDTSQNATTWHWDLGNGEESDDQNPSTVYYENGLYNVVQWVTSSTGCTDSIVMVVNIKTVIDEISDLIPNAISPNGDGVNDVWKLEFIKLLHNDATIIVVNRLGQTVFESIGYSEPWDGTFNGTDVPEGTYFYIIKVSEEEIYQGTILVLKNGK